MATIALTATTVATTGGAFRQGGVRRSRANLRPPSRSATVIDRLLKNQNPLENRNNLRPSSPHLVVGKHPGTAPQFCGPTFMDTGAIAVRIPNVRFRPSTTRRRGARRLPPARPRASRAGWRLRHPHHRLQQATAVLSSAGMVPVPPRFSDRKIAAQLFRRCPRPGETRIMPDSFVSSMGSAFTETG